MSSMGNGADLKSKLSLSKPRRTRGDEKERREYTVHPGLRYMMRAINYASDRKQALMMMRERAERQKH
jgi:hypothetical protein